VMLRDLDWLLTSGVEGIAIGVLSSGGTIDRDRCSEIRKRAGATPLVFHRAFDVTPDPLQAMEELVDLGFHRILTSGQQESAYNGIPLLSDLIRKSKGRIEILPAGGINRFTIQDIIARTGCDQVHASLQQTLTDPSTLHRPQITFGARAKTFEHLLSGTSPAAVEEMIHILKTI